MFYDDFYQETNEFDQQINEFKQSLMSSVKQEFLYKLNKLEKENNELQEIKEKWHILVQEYETKKRLLDQERQNAKQEAKRLRLSELIKDKEIIYYRADPKYYDKPKCERCNGNRQVMYVSPLGRDTYESCLCAAKITKYYPEKYVLYEFKIDEMDKTLHVWYKKLVDSTFKNDYFEGEISSVNVIYNESMNYESLTYYTYFKTKEECQKYCDWLNNKNENS